MAGRAVAGDADHQRDGAHAADPGTTTPASADDLWRLEDADEQARCAAENLERRMADLDLRNELALHRFTGPAWRRFAEELARYGHAVLMAWMATGEMFSQCRKKHCYPGPPPEQWTDDDRMGLANDTVAAAMVSFREQGLIGKKWDYTAGATLKTYFIGACIYQFPNHFRRWRTDDQTWNQLRRLEPGADELMHLPHTDATDDLAVTRVMTSTAFAAIPDDRTKSAMLLHSRGYTYPEIAEILGTSVKAVDGLLIRHRKRMMSAKRREMS
jgi:DNA-directed RNA polymerase specialized sigma24 family protein